MKYIPQESGESWDGAWHMALKSLNGVVLKCGEPIEGNCCYWDLKLKDANQQPDARILERRRVLARHAKEAGTVLEIGVNAGHGALVMIGANQDIDYTGVDIGRHAYTAHAASFLREVGTAKVIIGDSARVLPVLAVEEMGPFDLIHVDGAHDLPSAIADLLAAQRLVSDRGVVIVDDMHLSGPKKAVEAVIGGGWFTGSIGEQVAELRLS